MNNKFIQHIPGCCDGDEPVEFDFTSTDELLNNSFIKKCENYRHFYRFSISEELLIID